MFVGLLTFSPGGIAGENPTLEEKQIARLEELVTRDQFRAKRDARDLKAALAREIDRNQRQRATLARQAADYRALAQSARDQAAESHRRAQRRERGARDPLLSERTRAVNAREAASASRDAQADEARARERDAKAKRLGDQAAALEQETARLRQLIARLGSVIAYEPPPPPRDTETADSGAAPHAAPPFKMSLEDTLGVWRPVREGDWPLVIVQEDPDFEAYPYKLEGHTLTRAWQGVNFPSERGDAARGGEEGRVRREYTPIADEMNPQIPQWARDQ